MQNANDDEREELLNKFKNIKEAYEVLSDADKRKLYDAGDVKPPPGGWYVDLDAKILASLQSRAVGVGGVGRGGIFRGGIIAGGGGIGGVMRGGVNVRGMPMRAGNPIIRGNKIFFFK
jgi:DnaJ-class molecular chaperone